MTIVSKYFTKVLENHVPSIQIHKISPLCQAVDGDGDLWGVLEGSSVRELLQRGVAKGLAEQLTPWPLASNMEIWNQIIWMWVKMEDLGDHRC